MEKGETVETVIMSRYNYIKDRRATSGFSFCQGVKG